MALFSGFATEGPSRRRPFAFDFSPVLLAIQTRIDDNRRHSVRYKVSRVCHAIVYLPAVWEWKKEPFVFFFPPFSFSPTYFLSLPSSLFFPSFSLVFSFLLLFFLFFYKISRRKRTRTTRRLESEGTAPRFTRMFFITHRVHGTMWPRQLNTCSRASARQYPHKRERACTDVRAHLTMNARHTPEARPRATHNLARHNAARNCAHQPKSFVSSINPTHKSKRLSSLF